MARLKRADVAAPGFTRRRRGRGFEYLDELQRPVRDGEVLELTIGGIVAEFADVGEGYPAAQRSVEEGVIDLIAGDEASYAIERVA